MRTLKVNLWLNVIDYKGNSKDWHTSYWPTGWRF